jgi:hypothetical protein
MVMYSGIKLVNPDKPFVLIFDLFFRATLIEFAVIYTLSFLMI